jgi:hypothetical protein
VSLPAILREKYCTCMYRSQHFSHRQSNSTSVSYKELKPKQRPKVIKRTLGLGHKDPCCTQTCLVNPVWFEAASFDLRSLATPSLLSPPSLVPASVRISGSGTQNSHKHNTHDLVWCCNTLTMVSGCIHLFI